MYVNIEGLIWKLSWVGMSWLIVNIEADDEKSMKP